MLNLSIVTIVIIAANVVISLKGFDDRSFFERYKFNVGSIRRGEQIRMFSSGFLHADTTHLFMNMFTLYFFADTVVNGLSNIYFIIIYVASLIFGNLLSLYFHKDEYWYSAIGASGAVTGILYSAILLRPDMSLYMFFVPIPIPGYVFGIVWPILYALMGVSAFLTYSKVYKLFLLQLVFNTMWSWLFFAFHQPVIALIDIYLLIGLNIYLINVMRKVNKLAAYLFLPYII